MICSISLLEKKTFCTAELKLLLHWSNIHPLKNYLNKKRLKNKPDPDNLLLVNELESFENQATNHWVEIKSNWMF